MLERRPGERLKTDYQRLLNGPSFQPPGRVPEHPLVAAGGDEGFLDASSLGRVEAFADLIGEVEYGFDECAELLTAVSVYPLLVAGVGGAFVEQGLANFPIDPLTRQHRA
jgi:hypothetical protein